MLHTLKYIPGVQEACNKRVGRKPRTLKFIPDIFKTQEMCNEAIGTDPCTL